MVSGRITGREVVGAHEAGGRGCQEILLKGTDDFLTDNWFSPGVRNPVKFPIDSGESVGENREPKS